MHTTAPLASSTCLVLLQQIQEAGVVGGNHKQIKVSSGCKGLWLVRTEDDVSITETKHMITEECHLPDRHRLES